jgi:lysyl-tRNA synthetase class 2
VSAETATEQPRAEALVRAHGSDTLAFFTLRDDHEHLFAPDGGAVVSYRVHAGVLMMAADPVGPPDAWAGMAAHVRAHAAARGLKLAVFAAGERTRALFESLGMRSLYLGDEAIVETGRFSLQGRPIRKVRQSVNRLGRAGYTTRLRRLGDVGDDELRELEALAERARGDQPERGFAMEMDGLRGEHQSDTLVLEARDPEGRVRGLLHFVPCYGRPAASLSMMRRDRETPNGLTELLVVRAIEELRVLGVEEISLAFAAFGRWIRDPANAAERVAARVVRVGDRWFQIESLYKFNAKFFPRWEPRHLLYERRLGLPRAALAAMWAEGLLPEPRRSRGQ